MVKKENKGKKVVRLLEKYIIKKIPLFGVDDTIHDVLRVLEKDGTVYDNVDYVYVVDKEGKLLGVFSGKYLFNLPKKTVISKIMTSTRLVTVSRDMELERVADLALKHDLKAIPVVEDGKLLGVVSSRTIMSVVNRALKQDIFHFAGIHKSHLDFESSMEIPLFKIIKDRLLWLLIGLVGAVVMALYIGMFEETLSKYILIASFVPAIVYLSDALGTQLQAVFVRDLAVLGKSLNFRKYFFRQVWASFIISLVVGFLLFLIVSLIWQTKFMALIISFAAFVSLFFTSITALVITILIKKFKSDPALGSGPLATVISDVTTIVIYFLVVTLLL